jgi:hypothetical protein
MELTDQNKIFLYHLIEGKSPEDAYTLAGYAPDKVLAYELKEALSAEFDKIVTRYGFNKTDLKFALLKLLKLPQEESEISIKDKIKAIELAGDLLQETIPLNDILECLVINRTKPAQEDIDG